jgi:hypothetical protein
MSELRYYSRNGYQFQILKRRGDIARAIGRNGKSERHEVIHIIPDKSGEKSSAVAFWAFSNEAQAIAKFNEIMSCKDNPNE